MFDAKLDPIPFCKKLLAFFTKKKKTFTPVLNENEMKEVEKVSPPVEEEEDSI